MIFAFWANVLIQMADREHISKSRTKRQVTLRLFADLTEGAEHEFKNQKDGA